MSRWVLVLALWWTAAAEVARVDAIKGAVTATRLAPLVVYLMSTRCAPGGFDNLRARVAP